MYSLKVGTCLLSTVYSTRCKLGIILYKECSATGDTMLCNNLLLRGSAQENQAVSVGGPSLFFNIFMKFGGSPS